MYIKIFKRLRIYIAILTMLTVGLLSYKKDIVLANNTNKVDINTAKKEAIQRHVGIPNKGELPNSISRHNLLSVQRITCNTTAESIPYNTVKIRVYKHNSDMSDGLELLTSWGPQQFTYGSSHAINISTEFQDEVLVQVTYLGADNIEYLIGQQWLNGRNTQDLNFINEANRSNYTVSYSIIISNSSI